MPARTAPSYSLFLSCVLLLLLSLVCISAADAPIKYNKEHSNYGDFHNAAKHARAQAHVNQQQPGQASQKTEDPTDDLYWFFSLHDKNVDGYLDGHELRSAFVDAEGDGSDMDGDGKIEEPAKHLTLSELETMVDHVLGEDDLDGDGKISWWEYLQSQEYHKQT
ncbi:hypothetical protein HK104_001293 [Borealophlyctis nickersoniae]|nr:hypothetical protein HK104_001293 [Borealophlyctis nickersoniae]